MKLPIVEIFSDGGARPNPGPGGYGIIMRYKGIEKEFSGFEENTTNNRMELMGAIVALSKLKTKSKVNLYTDSSYVVNGIEKGWAKKWKENNWMRTKTEKAVNYDLWQKLLDLTLKHNVTFKWVKGHDGHKENERCDELATEEILKNTGIIELSNEHKIQKILNSNVDKSIKITCEGQACRKCGTSVIKKVPKKINTKNKSYYYKYYLSCPGCLTNYFIDEAKVDL